MNEKVYAPHRQGLAVRTGKVRVSYVRFIEPDPISDPPSWGANLIVPKSDTATLNELQAAAMEAGVGKFGKRFSDNPKAFKIFFRDGDTDPKADESTKGAYFMSARNKRTCPAIVDSAMRPLAANAVKSGDYVVASVYCHAFDGKGQSGVSLILDAVQFIVAGESLGGSGNPTALFESHGAPDAPATGAGSLL